LDPLLHNRAILLASMKELLEMAAFFGDNYERTRSMESLKQHKYFTLEAYRLSLRLLRVQKEIEDHDLD